MAVEIIEGSRHAGVVLTCEHASNHLPEPWVWPEADAWIVDTHWGFDPGAADVTRHLAAALGSPAVLAAFTRLLIDPNRPPGHETLFRKLADGHPVGLNADLTEFEQQARFARFHEAFHHAVDDVLGRYPHAMVLSVHSFTPVYEGGPPRPMEIGVLFDREEALAHAVAEGLARQGWEVALNEPYSGRGGLIYSAERHALRHGRAALELEIRQDVSTDPARHGALVASIRHALERAGISPRLPRGSS